MTQKTKIEVAAYQKAWREANKEHLRQYEKNRAEKKKAQKRERMADPELRELENARMRDRYANDDEYRERKNAYNRKGHAKMMQDPEYREAERVRSEEYRKENTELCLERCRPHYRKNKAKRRAAKLQRTPAWANEFFISEAYELAKLRTKLTGIEWHVDHIVPLRGKLASGLHVHNNLQVIPWYENLSKGNSYEIA